MEEKIKKSLEKIVNVESVYIHDASRCGYVILNDFVVAGIVLFILSSLVDINAIRCISKNLYRISFIVKD